MLWFVIPAYAADPLQSTWRASAEIQDVEADLRATVAELPGDAVVRWVVLRTVRPCRTLRVSFYAGTASVGCDEQRVATAPIDGRPIAFSGADGRPLTLTHRRIDDRTLVQQLDGRRGSRTSQYALLPDGRLEVTVTITGELLEQPLQYTLHYD
ncbi:MAG: hypothetical protein ABMB14_17270 [Myxococcota bacterium]